MLDGWGMQPDEWFEGLRYGDARQVMKEQATLRECRRIQSEAAARTWWASLSDRRRTLIHGYYAGSGE